MCVFFGWFCSFVYLLYSGDRYEMYPYLLVKIMYDNETVLLCDTAPRPGGRFKNTYELLNPRALKISMLYKNRIFQCMGKIFCVEFQRYPLKFHSKYLPHTLKDVHFIHR